MNHDTGHLATHSTSFLASVAMLWNGVADHAPPWALVPPLVLSAASLVGALWSARRVSLEMRHAQELHQVRLTRARLGLPEVGGLDGRP